VQLTGKTRVLGIFGDPVAHSMSPAMQNQALQQAGINAVYVPFHVPAEQLPQAVAAIRSLGIWGVNVTVPHKEAVCALLDDIDPAARLIGAVNTIVNHQNRLIGYNTDGLGFLRALAEDLHLNPEGKRILLMGAGGACRAALVSLCQAGASWVGIANRTRSRAEALVKEFGAIFPEVNFEPFGIKKEELRQATKNIDLLANTSAVGLKGDAFTDLPWAELSEDVAIYDMVYSQSGTPLVQEAKRRGHQASDGLGMLAGQGEEAFVLWTGDKPSGGLMKRCLLSELTT
jgi:shikimate dehydrogenase